MGVGQLLLCCLLGALTATSARADAPASETEAEKQRREAERVEIDRGETWAMYGVLGPIAAATAVAIVSNPSERDVPTGVLATIGGLWAAGGLWGTSLGHYRIGHPGYATLSGLGKTALLAGGVLAERALDRSADEGTAMNEERGGTAPLLLVLAIAGVVAWDVYDYFDIEDTVRARGPARVAGGAPRLVPILSAAAGRTVLGVGGRF